MKNEMTFSKLKKASAVTLGLLLAGVPVATTQANEIGEAADSYLVVEAEAVTGEVGIAPFWHPGTIGHTTAGVLNFRATAGGTSLGVLYQNTSITFLGTSGTWVNVRVNSGNHAGRTGWVHANYISFPSAQR